MAKGASKSDGVKRMTELIKGSHLKKKKAEERQTPQDGTQKEQDANKLKTTAGIIGGSQGDQKRRKPVDAKKVEQEEQKISHLAQMMRKPSKSLKDSGNIPDLKRELAKVKASSGELASKIVAAQTQIRKIEEGRDALQTEADALKAEETKLQESMVSLWREETKEKETLEAIARQKKEEEISLQELETASQELAKETEKTQKELKDVKKRLQKTEKNQKEIPDKITRQDAQAADNIRKISDLEKRLIILDKELATAKSNLESAIESQRAVAEEYDRVMSEKNNVEEAYSLYETVDKIQAEKDKAAKDIDGFKNGITEREKAEEESEDAKKTLKAQLEAEEASQREILKAIDANTSRQRTLDSKFTVYLELDNAAKELNDINGKINESLQAQAANEQGARDTEQSIQDAKNELQEIIEKEGQLKKKLEEVINEKQRLEEDLQEISEPFPHEKLIIELPDVLKEAIKKETEKITLGEEKIQDLEKEEQRLKDEAVKLKDREENDTRISKVKEKQLLFIKNKLGSSGYDEGERLVLRKQIDTNILERKELDARNRASDEERKHIKSKIAKTDRQIQKLGEEIVGLKSQIEEANTVCRHLDEEIKANRERRIKAWAGSVSFMRVLYPIKSQMDLVLDEKSKLKAEHEEALRLQKKTESDLDSSEKYLEKCRNCLSSMEEEYVGTQAKIYSLNKQNDDYRMEKETLARELKEEEEHLPILQVEAASLSAKLAEMKNQLADKSDAKKQREKNIRAQEADLASAKKRLEDVQARVKQTDERIASINRKLAVLSASVADENTRILKELDRKQSVERELTEYRKHQAIIESEINIIAGIYDGRQ